MATTRKHYKATAFILNAHRDLIADQILFNSIVDDFSAIFEEDNPNFNAEKFFDACNKED
jgi:hypothetical protein